MTKLPWGWRATGGGSAENRPVVRREPYRGRRSKKAAKLLKGQYHGIPGLRDGR